MKDYNFCYGYVVQNSCMGSLQFSMLRVCMYITIEYLLGLIIQELVFFLLETNMFVQ